MDNEHLEKIKASREKYKPEKINCLFIAEAPPSGLDRFFYFEEVWEQDSLYLEMMKVLFPEKPAQFEGPDGNKYDIDFIGGLSTSKLRNNKEEYLNKFKAKGYFLIDNLDYPLPAHVRRTKDKIEYLEFHKDRLYKEVAALVDNKTPIVLISVPVFQANAGTLKYYGLNIIHKGPIEFPGSGQQKKFREKMEKLIDEKLK